MLFEEYRSELIHKGVLQDYHIDQYHKERPPFIEPEQALDFSDDIEDLI